MKRFVSTDPATEQTFATTSAHAPAEVERRLARAERAAGAWAALTLEERAAHLRAAGARMEYQLEDLARLITREMGKTIGESRTEVRKCIDCLGFFADHAGAMLAPEEVEVPGAPTRAAVSYAPIGVIMGIYPWNFPAWQAVRAIAPALAAGNVIVFKHASNTMRTAIEIERLFIDAGLPAGVLQLLAVDGRSAERVIADPRVRAVTFTGSTATGARVAAAAGRAVKKSVLELGGSDPFIVLADADLDAAAESGAWMRCRAAGQSCICAKRFIVEEPAYDAFLERFSAAMRSRTVGDPHDEATQVGPLARADLRAALEDQIARTRAEGGRLVCGGERPFERGYFITPAVMEADETMTAFREETFGPLAAVVRAVDADDAVRLANASSYGLAASVWSRDAERAAHIAERIETGTVFVNANVASDFRLPFGGVKQSGYGKELGVAGIRELVNAKVTARPR